MKDRHLALLKTVSQRLYAIRTSAIVQHKLFLPLLALAITSGSASLFALQALTREPEATIVAKASAAEYDRVRSADRLRRDARPTTNADWARTVTTTGVVKPRLLVDVGSQLSGIVSELYVDFNEPVRKNQPLARLAPETFEAAAREARASLAVARATAQLRKGAIGRAAAHAKTAHSELAIAEARLVRARAEHTQMQRDLKRKSVLAKRGTLPTSELDRVRAATTVAGAAIKEAEAEVKARTAAVAAAEAEVDMAKVDVQVAEAVIAQRQAALDRAEVDLARTVIRSPLDGIIVARKVDVGQTVAASLNAPTLFMVARDLGQMEVHASVDEADIGQIRAGQRVTFTVDAYPDRHFQGQVLQVRTAPAVVQNVVTYTIVITTENKDKALMPGMTALVRIETNERSPIARMSRP